MKLYRLIRFLAVLLVLLKPLSLARAQSAADPNEGSRLSYDSYSASYELAWWGRAGRTYFVQHSEDLLSWAYLPLIESGADYPPIWRFTSTNPRFFLRLRYSDIPTDNPYAADFDGDKVSNYDELFYGTDPLVNLDTDHDGLPDDWERRHFQTLDYGANDNPDEDGLTNLEEFQHGTDPEYLDSDYDGLSDGDEVHIYHTDPRAWDTDGDEMRDGWEVLVGLNPLVKDAALDSDQDGLTNLEEYWYTINPLDPDTDGDGLTDGDEIHLYGTFPGVPDSDGDGLTDLEEVILTTDPTFYDTDHDGLWDGEEVLLYLTSPILPDTDNDTLPDKWELDNRLNPLMSEGALDSDDDGLINVEEFAQHTDPQDADTDGDELRDGDEVHLHHTDPLNFDSDFDGLPDGWEVKYSLNPLVANNASADPDGDGLTNAEEATFGTNPNNPDTDGDDTNDGPETTQGGDPNDASDGGQPPSGGLITLKLWLGAEQTAEGQPGSSHEDDFQGYRMKIYEKNDDGTDKSTPLYDYASAGTYVKGPTEFKFKKTKSYTVKIFTASTSPTGEPDKDFDYTALIKGLVILDDPDSILGDHEQDQNQGSPFPQRAKRPQSGRRRLLSSQWETTTT